MIPEGSPPPAPPTGKQAPEPVVSLRGVSKRFGDTDAVAAMDLDVQAGSLVGLIGPNGAGKTTTMRIIAGLIAPDEGTVSVCGANPLRQPRTVRRRVGWMPDFFGVYGGLTAREYLEFFSSAYKVPAAQRRDDVTELLDLVRLTDKAQTDVEGLSRGMQQRLGLARALVHDPDLLLLDEPASGLDPRARVELREILLALAGQGKTILLSSHILAELAEVCDTVIIMTDGRVVAAGSTEQLADERWLGQTEVTLRLADPTQTTAGVDSIAAAGATVVDVTGATVRFSIPGADHEVAALVRQLVTADIAIAELSQHRAGLEQLFMELTGEVGNADQTMDRGAA